VGERRDRLDVIAAGRLQVHGGIVSGVAWPRRESIDLDVLNK
jgi:hypothetical protein